MLDTFAAIFLVFATIATALFQIALTLGAPLGEYAFGGSHQGKLPKHFRVLAAVSAAIMLALAGHYLAQLGFFQPILNSSLNSMANWFMAGFFGLSAVLNNITKSQKERRLWGSTTIAMLLAALVVAL